MGPPLPGIARTYTGPASDTRGEPLPAWHLQDFNTVTRQYPHARSQYPSQFPMAHRRLVSRHHGQFPVAHRPSVPPAQTYNVLPPPASLTSTTASELDRAAPSPPIGRSSDLRATDLHGPSETHGRAFPALRSRTSKHPCPALQNEQAHTDWDCQGIISNKLAINLKQANRELSSGSAYMSGRVSSHAASQNVKRQALYHTVSSKRTAQKKNEQQTRKRERQR